MRRCPWLPLFLLALGLSAAVSDAPPPLDLGGVREEHLMIPMRDGVQLSAWLYHPSGDGPHPAVFEQRYARLTIPASSRVSADLARAGFVVAKVNFHGAQKSEGTYVGYRALGWTSLIFNRGHRIRVTVSSTGVPFYEPNNQTGVAQTVGWLKDTRAAENSIWHDAARPSAIVVPWRKPR